MQPKFLFQFSVMLIYSRFTLAITVRDLIRDSHLLEMASEIFVNAPSHLVVKFG